MRYIAIVFCLALSTTSYCFGIDPDIVRAEINKMVGDDYKDKFEVLKVLEVKSVTAVFLSPPYREFPNVILFKLYNGTYHRIFECLTIGISDSLSGILDLHTVKTAVDFQVGDSHTYEFTSASVRKVIKAGVSTGSSIIVYKNFMHMHPLPGISSFYTIDKTKFISLAFTFFGKNYWQGYPTSDCTMYDLPKLLSMNFGFERNRYVLTGHTSNNQNWTVSFSDVDNANEFLLGKQIMIN